MECICWSVLTLSCNYSFNIHMKCNEIFWWLTINHYFKLWHNSFSGTFTMHVIVRRQRFEHFLKRTSKLSDTIHLYFQSLPPLQYTFLALTNWSKFYLQSRFSICQCFKKEFLSLTLKKVKCWMNLVLNPQFPILGHTSYAWFDNHFPPAGFRFLFCYSWK